MLHLFRDIIINYKYDFQMYQRIRKINFTLYEHIQMYILNKSLQERFQAIEKNHLPSFVLNTTFSQFETSTFNYQYYRNMF